MSVDHYENFPVASWLCPPALRRPITAIYWFARTADDLADEGNATPAQRREDLLAYRADLHRLSHGLAPSPRWAAMFQALAQQMTQWRLPVPLLDDLLDAFLQDVNNPVYDSRDQLLDYCRRSANPVGRLLLHLHHIGDAEALTQSDAICSALQLINFWQDLSVDLPRGRVYLPAQDLRRHGLRPQDLLGTPSKPAINLEPLIAELCGWAEALMHTGAPLVHRLPGRAGWELRLVVQGGLRILEKIESTGHTSHRQRPAIGAWDAPQLLWRACRMHAPRATTAAPE